MASHIATKLVYGLTILELLVKVHLFLVSKLCTVIDGGIGTVKLFVADFTLEILRVA
jgi:hypothetical protein